RYFSIEKTVVSSALSGAGGTRGRGSAAIPTTFSPAQAAIAAGKRIVLKYESIRSSNPAACRTRRRPARVRSEEHTLNSSHGSISYAVFCLKKKKEKRSNKT